MRVQDLTGNHHAYCTIREFTASSHAGQEEVVFVAPFACEVLSIRLYFGTASVGQATNYTTITSYYGGTAASNAIGTVTLDASGTVAYGSYGSAYSGTLDCAAGSAIWLGYGTTGSGQDLPRTFVDVVYRGGSTRVDGTVMP